MSEKEINEKYINKFNDFFDKIIQDELIEPITERTAQVTLAQRISSLTSEEDYDTALAMLTDWLDEIKAVSSIKNYEIHKD